MPRKSEAQNLHHFIRRSSSWKTSGPDRGSLWRPKLFDASSWQSPSRSLGGIGLPGLLISRAHRASRVTECCGPLTPDSRTHYAACISFAWFAGQWWQFPGRQVAAEGKPHSLLCASSGRPNLPKSFRKGPTNSGDVRVRG